MSAPYLKPDKNGVQYVHWTEPSPKGKRGRSKRVSTRTKDLGAAKAFFGQWLLMGQGAAPSDVYTVEDLWDVYEKKHLEKNSLSIGPLRRVGRRLKRHFGRLLYPEVNQDAVDAYEDKRVSGKLGSSSGVMRSTVRSELLMLVAMFNWCADRKRKLIPAGDVPAFDLPPKNAARARWLEPEELERLAAAAIKTRRRDGRLSRIERFYWLTRETGARKTAVQQLQWSRVDFSAGMIDYNVPGRKITKKRRAVVAMSRTLRNVLEQAYKERISDFVLDSDADLYKNFKALARQAKVPNVSPHVMRHTAATIMLKNGVSVWTVSKTLEMSVDMVERTYGHLCPKASLDAVNQISQSTAPDSQTEAAMIEAIRSGKFKLVAVEK